MSLENAELRRLGDFTTNARVLVIAAIAIVVATFGFIAGVALLKLIWLFTNIAYFGRFSFEIPNLADSPLGLFTFFVPIIGSLIVGFMARYGSEKICGHGIPEAIEAILLGRSRLDAKVAVLKPLSSAIVIGTGGPFGAEGPIIMTGGALGSLIAQMLPVSDNERKTLLVAGAAAGMTTVFGTPVAAIMLAVELLLFEWTPRSFIPVAVAAMVAEAERTFLQMPDPLFPFHGSVHMTATGLLAWLAIGAAGGLLSAALTKLVYASEDLFSRLPIHWMWWPALGAIVVGAGGLIDPRALSVGYVSIEQLISGHLLAASAISLLVVKAIIWSVALGSGTSGGVLAPLLIIGGSMGALLVGIMPAASPGFWPLLAMTATLGGTMRAPLTATFFAMELTGASDLLLPLMATCVAAHTVTVLLMRRSILTEKLARRGHHLAREYRVDPFVLTQVSEVMTKQVETVPADMTLHQVVKMLTNPETRHPTFPVVDEELHVLGIVDPPAVMRWRKMGGHRKTTLRELLAGGKISVAYPDEYLEGLAAKLQNANISHLPVVTREGERLVGYVGWKDIMRVRIKLHEEQESRKAFFGFMVRGPAESASPKS
jgi:H+/Cl- antiporter ClcA/CBS domain-containing protein